MQRLREICEQSPIVEFAPGENLLEEGGSTGRLFVLASGEVEVVKGDVVVAQVDTPGALFGEMAILLDMPHTASVRARSSVTAHVVEDAETFLATEPEVGFLTAQLLANRLHAATAYLADIKAQYRDRSDQFGMIDTVLTSLLNRQAAIEMPNNQPEDDGRL